MYVGSLIQAGVTYLKAQGAVAVQSIFTAPSIRRTLIRNGFLPWHWGTRPRLHMRAERRDPELASFCDVPQGYLTMEMATWKCHSRASS